MSNSRLLKAAGDKTPLLVSYDVKLNSGETVVVGEKYLIARKREIRRLYADGTIASIKKRN